MITDSNASIPGDWNPNDNSRSLSSDTNSIAEYHGFDAHASHNVQKLAKTLTQNTLNSESSAALLKHMSHMSEAPGVLPTGEEGKEIEQLDPDSPNFNATFWVKNVRKLLDSDPEYYKPSKLGIAYRDLRAYGVANDSDYKVTVDNGVIKLVTEIIRLFQPEDESRFFNILKPMDAIMRPGELTVVLGRPGAGCSTLLKTIAAQTYGFHVGKESRITYDGLSQHDIQKHYHGDVIYSAEADIHFPHLTVGDTLNFAARLRTPQNRGENIDRETYAKHMASVYMATYGLSHTRNTNVGNDFVRGVSGGERKRVSIAEASLSGANIQCWDNATRGLDAATALEFIRALKTSAIILECTPLIAIYQCSQDAYDLFDNVVVLYEGYQIFFGKAKKAKEYFINMGYKCPQRQTTADFLTSLTNPAEREPLPGYENKVPRTPQEFEAYWRNSPEYAALTKEIDNYFVECEKLNTKQLYHDSHVAKQARHIRPSSPYTVSFAMQVKYGVTRHFLRMKGDPSIPLFSIFGQLIMGLVLSSVFYNQQEVTESFYYRSASMFFAVLFNAFASLLEVMSLYEARPIVEKHKKYALYRPSADALASIMSELPVKVLMSLSFNLVFYFMVNFRRNAGRFFFYMLISSWSTLTMSHIFRTIGAMTNTLSDAMTPATVLLLAMVIFTGFVIPTRNMLGWSRWINYLNPIGYVFESLMVNEFHNREFECSDYIPSGSDYTNVPLENRSCSVVGSVPGSSTVNGTDYLAQAYRFYNAHKWRNLGILIGFAFFFLGVYVVLTEFNTGAMQKGEIVLFLKGSLKKRKKGAAASVQNKDIETGDITEKVNFQDEAEAIGNDVKPEKEESAELRETFFWRDLTYQVRIKTEDRVILDHVDGWVKPGQITALMGASGAGKTTLLNCLSERVTSGIITDGERLVNGHALDSSFQRSIGYVQQQDIHLETSTVREALRFSAYLRQSSKISKKEKDEYVDYVIDLLEMTDYADALVGVAGEGLNVEQRKRLTIGVELVAKPKLLLFLDEPTSGLDSQTAWSICKLMRKLADHGQAILCTIHQPSALIMAEFDRLLFMQRGGKTVYFGDLGKNSQTMIDYFEKYGADPCPEDANPAEWMLQVVGAAPGSHAKQDYFEVWKNSEEYRAVKDEIIRMETELVKLPRDENPEAKYKYAAPIWKQYLLVTWRTIVQDWRSPEYIYNKLILAILAALFNGFSFFKAQNTLQGLQNQMFAVFMFFLPFNTLVQQMLPTYVKQRAVYEVREAPSRTFSWFAFIAGQISAEIPFMTVAGTLAFFCWYYPVGLYRNAEPTDSVNQRGVLMWMFLTGFFVYTSTMGQLCVSFLEVANNAANLANLLFTMCLNFCGVLATTEAMPGFWVFMYRCNPFTYLVQGLLATGLANADVRCASYEYVTVDPPLGESCSNFLTTYVNEHDGYLLDNADGMCYYCTRSTTNSWLNSVNALYSERWRNFGIFISFIAINIVGTVVLYWAARVPKGTRQKKS
ncbi:Multidrug resistance protein CDR1 [Candida viswanathii]|uniref:Multidrug resistance protein CDR1 n=1 Tax=Candida viswanathii TaxID=5486 RepID=A0A367XXT6_9ASCO|nr:Multidrug resistance protein CDR1 [Candida viswanathii]